MYHRIIATLVAAIVFFCSCDSVTESKAVIKPAPAATNIVTVTDTANAKAIFGQRLKITGDFDGDGKKDTVYESYISALTSRETFKTLDSTDWETNTDLIIKNNPVTRLYTNISGVDTFIITTELQQAGISLFENLGELNGEKGDELGYIINLANSSNINTYHIVSLSSAKQWKEIFSFPINEAVNFEAEEMFKNGSIIRKAGSNKIRYKFYSDSATVEEGEKIFH
jgi:hypothetical protein